VVVLPGEREQPPSRNSLEGAPVVAVPPRAVPARPVGPELARVVRRLERQFVGRERLDALRRGEGDDAPAPDGRRRDAARRLDPRVRKPQRFAVAFDPQDDLLRVQVRPAPLAAVAAAVGGQPEPRRPSKL
jgi:hypothetical protein